MKYEGMSVYEKWKNCYLLQFNEPDVFYRCFMEPEVIRFILNVLFTVVKGVLFGKIKLNVAIKKFYS